MPQKLSLYVILSLLFAASSAAADTGASNDAANAYYLSHDDCRAAESVVNNPAALPIDRNSIPSWATHHAHIL